MAKPRKPRKPGKKIVKKRVRVSLRNKAGATARGRRMAAVLGPTPGYDTYKTVERTVDVPGSAAAKERAAKKATRSGGAGKANTKTVTKARQAAAKRAESKPTKAKATSTRNLTRAGRTTARQDTTSSLPKSSTRRLSDMNAEQFDEHYRATIAAAREGDPAAAREAARLRRWGRDNGRLNADGTPQQRATKQRAAERDAKADAARRDRDREREQQQTTRANERAAAADARRAEQTREADARRREQEQAQEARANETLDPTGDDTPMMDAADRNADVYRADTADTPTGGTADDAARRADIRNLSDEELADRYERTRAEVEQYGEPPSYATIDDAEDRYWSEQELLELGAELDARRNPEENPFTAAEADIDATGVDMPDNIKGREQEWLGGLDDDTLEEVLRTAKPELADMADEELERRRPWREGGVLQRMLPHMSMTDIRREQARLLGKGNGVDKAEIYRMAAEAGNHRYTKMIPDETFDGWLRGLAQDNLGAGDPEGAKDEQQIESFLSSGVDTIGSPIMMQTMDAETRAMATRIGFIPNRANFARIMRGETPRAYNSEETIRRQYGARKRRTKDEVLRDRLAAEAKRAAAATKAMERKQQQLRARAAKAETDWELSVADAENALRAAQAAADAARRADMDAKTRGDDNRQHGMSDAAIDANARLAEAADNLEVAREVERIRRERETGEAVPDTRAADARNAEMADLDRAAAINAREADNAEVRHAADASDRADVSAAELADGEELTGNGNIRRGNALMFRNRDGSWSIKPLDGERADRGKGFKADTLDEARRVADRVGTGEVPKRRTADNAGEARTDAPDAAPEPEARTADAPEPEAPEDAPEPEAPAEDVKPARAYDQKRLVGLTPHGFSTTKDGFTNGEISVRAIQNPNNPSISRYRVTNGTDTYDYATPETAAVEAMQAAQGGIMSKPDKNGYGVGDYTTDIKVAAINATPLYRGEQRAGTAIVTPSGHMLVPQMGKKWHAYDPDGKQLTTGYGSRIDTARRRVWKSEGIDAPELAEPKDKPEWQGTGDVTPAKKATGADTPDAPEPETPDAPRADAPETPDAPADGARRAMLDGYSKIPENTGDSKAMDKTLDGLVDTADALRKDGDRETAFQIMNVVEMIDGRQDGETVKLDADGVPYIERKGHRIVPNGDGPQRYKVDGEGDNMFAADARAAIDKKAGGRPAKKATAKKATPAKKSNAHKKGEPFEQQHLADGETIGDTGAIQRGEHTIITNDRGYQVMQQYDNHRIMKPVKTLAAARKQADRMQAARDKKQAELRESAAARQRTAVSKMAAPGETLNGPAEREPVVDGITIDRDRNNRYVVTDTNGAGDGIPARKVGDYATVEEARAARDVEVADRKADAARKADADDLMRLPQRERDIAVYDEIQGQSYRTSEVADMTGLTRAQARDTLRRLEANGLVFRSDDNDNQGPGARRTVSGERTNMDELVWTDAYRDDEAAVADAVNAYDPKKGAPAKKATPAKQAPRREKATVDAEKQAKADAAAEKHAKAEKAHADAVAKVERAMSANTGDRIDADTETAAINAAKAFIRERNAKARQLRAEIAADPDKDTPEAWKAIADVEKATKGAKVGNIGSKEFNAVKADIIADARAKRAAADAPEAPQDAPEAPQTADDMIEALLAEVARVEAGTAEVDPEYERREKEGLGRGEVLPGTLEPGDRVITPYGEARVKSANLNNVVVENPLTADPRRPLYDVDDVAVFRYDHIAVPPGSRAAFREPDTTGLREGRDNVPDYPTVNLGRSPRRGDYYTTAELEERGWTRAKLKKIVGSRDGVKKFRERIAADGDGSQRGDYSGYNVNLYSRARIELAEAEHPDEDFGPHRKTETPSIDGLDIERVTTQSGRTIFRINNAKELAGDADLSSAWLDTKGRLNVRGDDKARDRIQAVIDNGPATPDARKAERAADDRRRRAKTAAKMEAERAEANKPRARVNGDLVEDTRLAHILRIGQKPDLADTKAERDKTVAALKRVHDDNKGKGNGSVSDAARRVLIEDYGVRYDPEAKTSTPDAKPLPDNIASARRVATRRRRAALKERDTRDLLDQFHNRKGELGNGEYDDARPTADDLKRELRRRGNYVTADGFVTTPEDYDRATKKADLPEWFPAALNEVEGDDGPDYQVKANSRILNNRAMREGIVKGDDGHTIDEEQRARFAAVEKLSDKELKALAASRSKNKPNHTEATLESIRRGYFTSRRSGPNDVEKLIGGVAFGDVDRSGLSLADLKAISDYSGTFDFNAQRNNSWHFVSDVVAWAGPERDRRIGADVEANPDKYLDLIRNNGDMPEGVDRKVVERRLKSLSGTDYGVAVEQGRVNALKFDADPKYRDLVDDNSGIKKLTDSELDEAHRLYRENNPARGKSARTVAEKKFVDTLAALTQEQRDRQVEREAQEAKRRREAPEQGNEQDAPKMPWDNWRPTHRSVPVEKLPDAETFTSDANRVPAGASDRLRIYDALDAEVEAKRARAIELVKSKDNSPEDMEAYARAVIDANDARIARLTAGLDYDIAREEIAHLLRFRDHFDKQFRDVGLEPFATRRTLGDYLDEMGVPGGRADAPDARMSRMAEPGSVITPNGVEATPDAPGGGRVEVPRRDLYPNKSAKIGPDNKSPDEVAQWLADFAIGFKGDRKSGDSVSVQFQDAMTSAWNAEGNTADVDFYLGMFARGTDVQDAEFMVGTPDVAAIDAEKLARTRSAKSARKIIDEGIAEENRRFGVRLAREIMADESRNDPRELSFVVFALTDGNVRDKYGRVPKDADAEEARLAADVAERLHRADPERMGYGFDGVAQAFREVADQIDPDGATPRAETLDPRSSERIMRETTRADLGVDGDLVIEHTPEGGTLIHGTSRGDGTNQVLKANGWRWSRNLGAWYVPRSRDQRADSDKIDRTATALEADGHKVGTDIDDTIRSAAEREAAKVERADDRAEALANKATRKRAAADTAWEKDKAATDKVPPMGEPIKVGHHSERGHRRAVERAWQTLGNALDAEKDAKEADRRAKVAARANDARYNPVTVANRIDKLEADIRRMERARATGPELDTARDDLAYWRGVHEQHITEGKIASQNPDDYKPGRFLMQGNRLYRIAKVNKKSLGVETEGPTEGKPGLSKISLNKVTGRQLTPEEADAVLRERVADMSDDDLRNKITAQRGVHSYGVRDAMKAELARREGTEPPTPEMPLTPPAPGEYQKHHRGRILKRHVKVDEGETLDRGKIKRGDFTIGNSQSGYTVTDASGNSFPGQPGERFDIDVARERVDALQADRDRLGRDSEVLGMSDTSLARLAENDSGDRRRDAQELLAARKEVAEERARNFDEYVDEAEKARRAAASGFAPPGSYIGPDGIVPPGHKWGTL